MNKNQQTLKRANYLAKRLEELFPGQQMPPLHHHDAFTLLIAVLLSAQCRDDRVNQVTPKLFELGPNPLKMSKLSVETIQKIIKPCGLSAKKAKAIKELSEILVAKYNSQVPGNLEDLESLPGVGHKTAQVVLIQAFQIPAFPVDTHIHRLATTWELTKGKNVMQTEADLKSIYDESQWSDLHLRIIFYGREYCSARGCDGKRCLLCQELTEKKFWKR